MLLWKKIKMSRKLPPEAEGIEIDERFMPTEKFVKKEIIYNGQILQLRRDEVVTPKGKTVKREFIVHNGGVCILPVRKDGKIGIVKQFRYPTGESTIEFPAGKLEKGEDPYKAALRELEEEVGYKAGKLTPYGVIYPCVGYSNEVIYLFVAEDLTQTQTNFDDDEYLVTKWFGEEELKWMFENDMFRDAKTIVLLCKYLSRNLN